MQFLLGFLIAACIALAIALVLVSKKAREIVNRDLMAIDVKIDDLVRKVVKLPPPVNIIHLGINPKAIAKIGADPVGVSINPEDFAVKADRLRAKLLEFFNTENHPDMSTRAFCILNRAGVYDILSNESAGKTKAALTRLILNGDTEATKRFLETLADSVAAATTDIEPV